MDTQFAKHHGIAALGIILALAACGAGIDSEHRYAAAAESRDGGEYRTAMIELKNLLQDDPEHAEARLMLGEVSLLLGQPVDAQKELERALELGIERDRVILPLTRSLLLQNRYNEILENATTDGLAEDLHYDVIVLRGQAYLGLEKVELAEETFLNGMALSEQRPDAYIGLARVAALAGDFQKAENLILQAVSVDPENFQTWLVQGEFELFRGNAAGAEASFERAVELAGDDPSRMLAAKLALAETKLTLERTEEAIQLIEELNESVPKHPRVRFVNARLAYNEGRKQEVTELLQTVVLDFPGFVPAHLLLGAAHYDLGNLGQAETHLQTALAEQPGNLTARKMLAAVLAQRGDPEQVLETLGPALEAGQVDAQLLGMLGEASLRAGDVEAGVSYLKQGLEADPANPIVTIQLATALVLSGEYEQAIETLNVLPPETEPPFRRELLLMLAHLRNDQADQALAIADQLLQIHPDESLVYNLIGSIHLGAGELGAAGDSFEQASKANPENPLSSLNLARLAVARGDTEAAVSHLEEALRVDPGNETALLALAGIDSRLGREREATARIEQAVAEHPESVRPRILLARAYISSGDIEQAEEQAAVAVDHAPDEPAALTVYGMSLLIGGKTNAAVAQLLRVVELRPGVAKAYSNLARAQYEAGDIPGAKESLARALEIDPDDLDVSVRLSRLLVDDAQHAEAMEIARRLRRLHPDSPLPYMLEGDIYSSQKKHDSALVAYRNGAELYLTRELALRIYATLASVGAPSAEVREPLTDWLERFPEDIQVRLALAQSYQADDQRSDAIAEYELIIEETPDYAEPLNNLAWLYHLEGDDRALPFAERAHELTPDNGAITDTLGWILVSSGELERGLALLETAAQQSPGIPDIHYHVAWALAESGQTNEARQLLDTIVSGDDEFESRNEAEALFDTLK